MRWQAGKGQSPGESAVLVNVTGPPEGRRGCVTGASRDTGRFHGEVQDLTFGRWYQCEAGNCGGQGTIGRSYQERSSTADAPGSGTWESCISTYRIRISSTLTCTPSFFFRTMLTRAVWARLIMQIPREEPLPKAQSRRTENCLRNTLECMNMVGLHIKPLLLPCCEGAHRVALKYAGNGICGENTKCVVERAAGSGGRPVTSAPRSDVPLLHEICPEWERLTCAQKVPRGTPV